MAVEEPNAAYVLICKRSRIENKGDRDKTRKTKTPAPSEARVGTVDYVVESAGSAKFCLDGIKVNLHLKVKFLVVICWKLRPAAFVASYGFPSAQ